MRSLVISIMFAAIILPATAQQRFPKHWIPVTRDAPPLVPDRTTPPQKAVVLKVMPVPPPGQPEIKEFRVDRVHFKSIADCDAAGRLWMNDLTNAAYREGHELIWGGPPIAPEGATVTYTCEERTLEVRTVK